MSPATPSGKVAGAVSAAAHPIITGEGAVLSDMAKLSVGDEKSVEIKSEASGSYSGKIRNGDGYSPGVTRPISDPFVRKSVSSQSDDVFQRTPGSRPNSSQFSTPKSQRIMNSDNWRSGSSSSRGSTHASPVSPSMARLGRAKAKTTIIHDDAGEAIKAENAQLVYPPACCVFVANLLQSENEESLQMAVTQIFREFGPVFVKIRRDSKQMPFAFCQYTKEEHAERAIKEGKGRLIKGRPCRCEKAKAHRITENFTSGLFLIERKFGAVITPEEARELLQSYGTIELCHTASHVERSALNLNEGVIIQFEMYDEGQNAYSAYRNHDTYKMQSIASLGSPARNIGGNVRSPPIDTPARQYLARYEVDRRSIFVGNLPAGTTEGKLHDLFSGYGHIVEIIIRDTVSKFDPSETLAFAFIEYRSVGPVNNAITDKNLYPVGGRLIRVMPKNSDLSSRDPAASRPVQVRRQPATPVSSYQSPSPSTRNEQQSSPYESPMSHMSPPLFGSPYAAYPYSPYSPYTPYSPYAYAYPPTAPYVTDSGSVYPPASYSPAYYSHQGSPSYDPRTSSPADAPAAANTHPGYYGYAPYQYGPAPYWAAPNPGAEQQASSQVAHYPPVYAAPVETSTGGEDRAATPTPAEHTPVTEDSVEAH